MKRILIGAFALLALVSCNKSKELQSVVVSNTLTFPIDGEAKVTWIQDNMGVHNMPVSLFTVTDSTNIDSAFVANGIPASMSSYLLCVGDKKALFDAGNGGERGFLVRKLDSLGVAASDIDYLFITHFHGDHIGGMLNGDKPVFENAQVYAAKLEYDGWIDSLPADKNQLQVKTMKAYETRLNLFNYGDTLPLGVVAIDAKGHTPGHTVFQYNNLLVIGDLIHGAALQLVDPNICAVFDQNKEQAIESRKRILQYAAENNMIYVGMHTPPMRSVAK